MEIIRVSHAPRIRAHVILLSDAEFKISLIATIYKVCRQTVSSWITAWNTRGICGLIDLPCSGRPRILQGKLEVDTLTRISQIKRRLEKVF